MSELKTVFVTGASGYIGKHIVLQLLEGGYAVKGSVRSDKKAEEVRTTIAAHLGDTAILDRLELVNLDLTSDNGWEAALVGADVLFHTASPFPLADPKVEDDLVRPAVDGTLRALKAAKVAGIHRVVLTSSSVAIMGAHLEGRDTYTEADWSDIDRPNVRFYEKSKVLAERAAWEYVADHPDMQLTTINPVLVLGAALDEHFGASLSIVQRLLRGNDPAMPRLSFPIVHVRDIARMHIAAMEREESIGRRFIGGADSLWFIEVAKILKDKFPSSKVKVRKAPDLLIRIVALFDASIRGILPDLGLEMKVDNTAARETLGIDFTSATDTVQESGAFLMDNRYV